MVDLSLTNIQNTNNYIINTQKETKKYEDTLKALGGVAENVFKEISSGVATAAESIGKIGFNALSSCDSFKTISSSWNNMLSGLAEPDINFDVLMQNLTDTLDLSGGEIEQNLQNVFSNISGMLTEFAPIVADVVPSMADVILPEIVEMGSQIITSASSALSSFMPLMLEYIGGLTPSVSTAVTELIDAIVQNLPMLLQVAVQMVECLTLGLAQALPTLIPQIINMITEIANIFSDNLDIIIEAAFKLVTGLAEGITQALPMLLEQIPEIIVNIADAISDSSANMNIAASEIVEKLVTGLITAIPSLVVAVPKLIAAILIALDSGLTAMIGIGVNIVKGIGKGIVNSTDWLLKKIKSFAKTLTDGIKEFFGIHSPSRVMRDEVGRYIALGMAAGITENSKEVNEAFKGMLDMLEYRRKLDLINDEEYYESLENLRDRYFAVGTKEWIEYTEKIYTYQKSRLEQVKKDYRSVCNEVYDYTSKKLDDVIKKQEAYSDKLKNFGRLFKTVTIELDEGDISYYSLADLKKDTEEIKRYSDMLTALRTRLLSAGIDEVTANSFFNEIASLSVEEGIKSLEALERADEKSLTQYITAYGEKIRLTDKISSEAYRSEFDNAVAESEEYMVKRLTEAGFEVPASFFDTGTLAARNFGEAFAAELDAELEKIKIKIDYFNAKLSLKTESTIGAAVSQVYNTYKDYQSTYNINSDGGDIYSAIKNYDTMRRMLGY